MRRTTALLAGVLLLLLGNIQGAETKNTERLSRFYGKITVLDTNSKAVTVFNKKSQLESEFLMSPDIKVVYQKRTVPQTKLEVGQNLVVSYLVENNQKIAKRITIRQDKKSANP